MKGMVGGDCKIFPSFTYLSLIGKKNKMWGLIVHCLGMFLCRILVKGF